MNIQSFSPSLSIPQNFLKNLFSDDHHSRENKVKDDDHHHDRENKIEDRDHHSRKKRVEDHDKPHKIHNRLAEDRYQPSQPSIPEESTAMVTTEMAVQSQVTNVSRSADVQITTKQGDVITISLSESASSSQTEFQAQQGDNEISIYNESNSFQSGFSITIEGNLNEDEQDALADLVDKMSDISEKFFKGNVKSAFKHAQKVGFDTEQIAGFSMDLNSEKSVEAIAAYQQTTMPEQNINTDLLKQAGDFLTQTKEFMADTGAQLESFAEPEQAFTELFAGVGQMNAVSQDEVEGNESMPSFLKMIENISHDIFDAELIESVEVDEVDPNSLEQT